MLLRYRLFDPDPRQKSIAVDLYSGIKDLPIISPHGHPAIFESLSFHGQGIVSTGGSGVLGGEMARALFECGANVTLLEGQKSTSTPGGAVRPMGFCTSRGPAWQRERGYFAARLCRRVDEEK